MPARPTAGERKSRLATVNSGKLGRLRAIPSPPPVDPPSDLDYVTIAVTDDAVAPATEPNVTTMLMVIVTLWLVNT